MNFSREFKQKYLLALSAMLCGLVGCSSSDDKVIAHYVKSPEIKDGKLIDYRDGNEYGVALIGNLYWMTDNLRYADSTSTPNLKGNSWCYENDSKECEKHGRLYSWNGAMDIEENDEWNQYSSSYQGICPEGWHIPSSQEWNALSSYVDANNGDEGVGTSLKSVEGWDKSDSAATSTNRFGFNATASGRRNNDGTTFMSTGDQGFYWTSNGKDKGTAYGWNLRHDIDLLQEGVYYKDHGLSVRCVAPKNYSQVSGSLDSSYIDKIPHGYGTLEFEGTSYRTVKIAGLTWMADNLNYEVEGSHCYNDDKENCKEFGRLYSFDAAQKACPEGWHLPTSAEFTSLFNHDQYSRNIRSKSGWTDKTSKGLNFWGFDAKAAGGKENSDYFDLKMSAYFWIDAKAGDNASVFWISYYDNRPTEVKRDVKNEFSVRCVKNLD